MSPEKALVVAIKKIGGKAALARHRGVTPQAVGQWKIAPADHVLKIEELTGGKPDRHALRPDIFGERQA